MKPALRTPLLTFHLWTGITVGLVFMVVALSGAALIFRTKLERALDPQRFMVTPGDHRLPIDDLVARAKAAHPGPEFLSVRFWSDPTAPFTALFSDKKYVHLNPYTGAVLGVRARYGEGFGWIEGLHKYLLLEPGLGENVNGTFAFIFVALLSTGIVLWWPATRRALVAGLTFNRKLSGRPWNLNLHKTIGIYAALVLSFSALSGIPISFESTRAVLDAITFSKRDELPVAVPGQKIPFAGFDAAERQINYLMPNARETYIPLPKKGLVASYAIAADAPHPNARSYVYLDPAANVARYTPFAQASAGYRLYYWMLSLHTAVTGGWVVQLLLLFATLSVPVLAWTGVASYLRRKARVRAPIHTPSLRNPEPVSAK
jgi:vanillate O-demethylase ferredoxin subunit